MAAQANAEGEEAQRIMHYSPEGISKHRERLDLFIDLIWVGIIGNLSEVFSAMYFHDDSSAGNAVGLFILLFLPSWRIWNFLREFLNNYYMDDGKTLDTSGHARKLTSYQASNACSFSGSLFSRSSLATISHTSPKSPSGLSAF
jgi:hypothetical protein